MMHRLLNMVYPPLCHLCDCRLLPDEQFVCSGCMAGLSRSGCNSGSINPVAERLAGIVPYVEAAGVFIYSPGNSVARLTYDFKYHGYGGLARRMGQAMYDEMIYSDFFTDIDALVPVPIHWLRRMRRTYNQSEMLARGISDRSGIPVVDVLRARRHKSQTRLQGAKRRMNTSGKYRTVKSDRLASDAHVVLVDDVCTTGSTVCEAARALLTQYPSLTISVLTYAVTV